MVLLQNKHHVIKVSFLNDFLNHGYIFKVSLRWKMGLYVLERGVFWTNFSLWYRLLLRRFLNFLLIYCISTFDFYTSNFSIWCFGIWYIRWSGYSFRISDWDWSLICLSFRHRFRILRFINCKIQVLLDWTWLLDDFRLISFLSWLLAFRLFISVLNSFDHRINTIFSFWLWSDSKIFLFSMSILIFFRVFTHRYWISLRF